MKKYDSIVIGSGASGLTMALLLGLNRHKVLLLERGPQPGGSLARFTRDGVPFDTGFHFTGGLNPGGLLDRMCGVLGVRDLIQPVFMATDHAHEFRIESAGQTFALPAGTAALRTRLADYFPGERQAIDRYFARVDAVCANTATLDLTQIGQHGRATEEEYVSLRQVLDGLTGNPLLKALLSGFAMCHGTKPADVSFANHSRVCVGLYESTARIEGGGEALIAAFRRRLAACDVELRTNTWIDACLDVADDRVGRVRLNTGEEVAFDNGVLTIHPWDILRLLPAEHLSKAFASRVRGFESAAGFFTVFATLSAPQVPHGYGSSIVSLFPGDDFDAMLDPAFPPPRPLVIVKSLERTRQGTTQPVLTAFEPSFPEHVAAWSDSRTGHRPSGYEAYKAETTARIRDRLLAHEPELGATLKIVAAASLLTYRDYLHSPDGSAYGIKQKVGQFNLFGKLPLRNLYAAGQSALLPGLVGAMMSSFIVCRSVIGKEPFTQFMQQRL